MKTQKLICSLLLLLACVPAVRGVVMPTILHIDISDPSAVAFYAVPGTVSAVDDNTHIGIAGITLQTFFTTDVGTGNIGGGTGNLRAAGTTTPYDFVAKDNSSGSSVDLSIFNSSNEIQDFKTTTQPFTGAAVFDLSLHAAFLPANGATGFIQTGWSGDPGQIMGMYLVVVPEPASIAWGVAGGGMCLVAIWRKRRAAGNAPVEREWSA